MSVRTDEWSIRLVLAAVRFEKEAAQLLLHQTLCADRAPTNVSLRCSLAPNIEGELQLSVTARIAAVARTDNHVAIMQSSPSTA